MFIKNRNIIITFLIVILIITVYFYLNQDQSVFQDITHQEKEIFDQLNLTMDDDQDEDIYDFFIEYKLKRERLRSKEMELLKEIIHDPNSDNGTRKEAQNNLHRIIRSMEKELIVENMIKGKGYDDSIIYLSDDFASVIVKTKGLDDKQVAQICDIVSRGTNLSLDKITITEHN